MIPIDKVFKILGLALFGVIAVLDLIFCTKVKAVMWANCAVVVALLGMLGYDYFLRYIKPKKQ